MESDWAIPPDMPVIEGLVFRSSIGEEDADALAAVHAESAEYDQVDPLSTIGSYPTSQDFQASLAKAAVEHHLDQYLVADFGGQVVGYAAINRWHEEDGRWVYRPAGWVLPRWRGRGIGTTLLRWGERRARSLAAEEHPGELFEYAGIASSTQPDVQELLKNEGYTLAFTDLEMELDPAALLPDHPLPPGIEVRPALEEHIPLVGASIAESYRGEFTNDRFRDTHSEAAGQTSWYSEPVHDRALWQVAWDGNQVVGQVLPMIERGRGVIDECSVRPGWRRKGIARALLLRALRALRSRGMTVIRLNTQNEFRTRARDLYTSVGFRVVKEFPQYRKQPEQRS